MTILPFDLPEQPTPALPPRLPAPAGRLAPERIYESPLATVWHGDARDVLTMLDTESVDLVVTDPPYGVQNQSRRRAVAFDMLDGDRPEDRHIHHDVIRECIRVVRQHRHLYVFGPADVLEGQKVSDVATLYWDKGTMGSGDLTAPWGPQIEHINFTVSKHRHAGKAGLPTIPTRLRKGNLLSFTRPTGRNVRHPDEKPVALMRELIESSSRQGETVLDAYGGCGPVGVAAILTGRRTIIIEKKREYADLAASRIEATEAAVANLARL